MSEAAYYDHALGPDPAATVRRQQADAREMARLQGVVDAIPAGTRRVLDVGCGAGIALDLIARQRADLEAVGLELSPVSVATGRSLFGVDIVEGSADALPFADGAFDVVLATELFEHLPHGVYDRARREVARVASAGAIVTVPFREQRATVTCPACGCRFNPFRHLRSFDDGALAELLPGLERTALHITWTRGFFPGIRTARRLKAALGRPAPLPRHTRCPQCDYARASTGSGVGPGGEADPGPARRILTRAMGFVPRPRRPRWARAIYRRG